jgi:serpin B
MKLSYIYTIIVAVIVSIASIFIAFQYQPVSDIIEEEIPEDKDELTPKGELLFNEAVNSFAFDFFKGLNKESEGNLFISPYSIFTALAMTYEGARNETAEEMASVLNIEQDNDSFHQYMKGLYEYLNENAEYNISTANAMWVRENFELLQDYIDVIQNFYSGEASVVDFSNPVKASDLINSWIENKTNNLIKDLISPSAINPALTMLVLTNAIYFKGIWQTQFDEVNTTDRDFVVSDGNNVTVPTMRLTQTEDIFNYTETEDLQILELPYTGDGVSMVILLPKDGVDMADVINSIDEESYSNWIDSLNESYVDIYLPKFKFETSYLLNDYLIDLGMQNAFSGQADFSGIDGRPDLSIDSVIHKAFIEVNEEGTEAAAATAVIMTLTINGHDTDDSRIVFDCDHPFLFLIQHKDTGTILFLGSVNNPSE